MVDVIGDTGVEVREDKVVGVRGDKGVEVTEDRGVGVRDHNKGV